MKKLFILCLFLINSPLWAENLTIFPPYTIHHNAFTTDFLSPEIARSYHIKRSKNQAMINISIIKNQSKENIGTAVTANVKVIAKNLLGQLTTLEIREIKEADAVYYIADFPVSHRALLRFDIQVQAEKKGQYLNTRLQQEFFTD